MMRAVKSRKLFRMPTYPVVWKTLIDGEAATPGHLEIGPSSLAFRGGTKGAENHVEIPLTDICGVSHSHVQISRLPSVRLDVHGLGVLIFAAIGGIALRAEILEQLQELIQ